MFHFGKNSLILLDEANDGLLYKTIFPAHIFLLS